MAITGAIADALLARRFRYVRESDLHEGIAETLKGAGIFFEREKHLSDEGRVDFGCPPVAVEVKVDGALSAVTRQLMRYADLTVVEAVVLVTTKMRHRNMPAAMRGKPLRVVYLSSL